MSVSTGAGAALHNGEPDSADQGADAGFDEAVRITDLGRKTLEWLEAEESAYGSVTGLHMSRCPRLPELARDDCLLSNDELSFFRKFGFLVKRRLLDASDLDLVMRQVWDLIEAIPPEGRVSRREPETWLDPGWKGSGMPLFGPYRGRAPVFTGPGEVKLHAFGATEPMLGLLPNNPAVQGIARMILGEDLKEVHRVRGVYALFPTTEGSSTLGPHIDRSAQQLNVCAYLREVAPRNGGFTIWPGSHALTYQAMELESNFSPRPEFGAALGRCLADIVPVEIVGGPGDVVFWHGRAVHSAGIHVGKAVRFAAFADFQLQPSDGEDGFFSAEELARVGQFEWFKDTRLYRADRPPCREDMFRHWRMHSDQRETE